MIKYYAPRHFDARELVPQEIYEQLGEKSILVMDDRILKMADAIRDFFGMPITINTWCFNGDRKYSGYRDKTCKVGSLYSQHKFGRAVDMLIKDVSAEEARSTIMANQEQFKHIKVMEALVPWLHIDCRCTKENGIVLINP